MRIAMLIYSLGPGGAEGVIAETANQLAARGHDVLLLTIHSTDDDFHRVEPVVDRRALDAAAPSPNPLVGTIRTLRRAWSLRRGVRSWRADIAVSFIDRMNVLALGALAGAVPVVVSERVDPRSGSADLPTRLLRWALYRRARAVVVQTEAISQLARRWGAPVHVIANAVPDRFKPVARPASIDQPTVVAMGRLAHQKAFDVLLRAFAAVDAADWRLVLYGDGPERERLQHLVVALGLSTRVSMPGIARRPEDVLASADLFVLPSRYEGFPNVLVQAMACGVPVISTDCPSGPAEIIDDGVNGVLVAVDDVDGLAESMRRLMRDPARRRDLAAQGLEVRDRFSNDEVTDKWDALLRHCVRKR